MKLGCLGDISTADGVSCIAQVQQIAGDDREQSERRRLTAFIVQTVNSHHRLVEALEAFAFVGEDHPKDTQAVWEMIYRDRVQDWFSYEDFERARDLLAALKEAGRG